ncbi:hypothetical protein Rcae01_01788 [Novipirellula caenicola]|uniref:Uncharacterized protein n=1 Tax=Novipirellula caenicola TaxID=1536901 RepID=A0ABP9VNH2_9BACT
MLHKTAARKGRIIESTAAFVARVQEEKWGPTKDSFVTLVRGIRFVKSTILPDCDGCYGANYPFTRDGVIAPDRRLGLSLMIAGNACLQSFLFYNSDFLFRQENSQRRLFSC